MATEHHLIGVVRNFYNDLNVNPHISSRCNDEQLTERQKSLYSSLSESIKKRYFGSGLNFPENVEGKRILDIGCGSGSFVFLLSKLVGPTGYVVGVDVCDGLIETAKSESDYHCQQWGYDKPNFEFHVQNAETLEDRFKENEFDLVVSNGVMCLVPDKERAFRGAFRVLKPGGQFYLNDVYAESPPPAEHRDNEKLWSMGTTGAIPWKDLSDIVTSAGFTKPYLTCAAPILISNQQYLTMLKDIRFTCAGWRLFKLDPKTIQKKGPSLVTYNGGISDHPDCFPWDIDTTFKRGEGVEVDGDLSTLLANCYLSPCFSFQTSSAAPTTPWNQDPFALMDKMAAQGKLPDKIYEID